MAASFIQETWLSYKAHEYLRSHMGVNLTEKPRDLGLAPKLRVMEFKFGLVRDMLLETYHTHPETVVKSNLHY